MISENIRKARKAAGLSQIELADRLGVYQRDVSCWERGVHLPSLKTFANLCRELKCSADEILDLKPAVSDPEDSRASRTGG